MGALARFTLIGFGLLILCGALLQGGLKKLLGSAILGSLALFVLVREAIEQMGIVLILLLVAVVVLGGFQLMVGLSPALILGGITLLLAVSFVLIILPGWTGSSRNVQMSRGSIGHP